MNLARTDRIGGYRITELLHRGTTSHVVAAVHEGPSGFAQRVAMKTLRGAVSRDPAWARELALESGVAASVYHPHVAQVHGYLEERERGFLIMELVRGWSVRALGATLALCRRRAAFDVAVALVRDAARGAHALHDAGVRHRNLSPDNLLVAAGGHLKIIDFGAASWDRLEHGQPRPAPVFDVAYAAPETALGLRVDRAGDVFSLGAVLHELCLGAPPPVAPGWPCWRGAAIAEAADLPEGLGAVIERALRYAAGDRFATAGDLADALDDVAAHHGWRTSSATIDRCLRTTFAPRPAAAPTPTRRPTGELGRTRVRLRRMAT